MKTSFPKRISPRSTQPRRALTILEMLVSVALLSFIVLGLTAMFIQTQKAFKTGIKQTTVTDAGRSVLDMIASDLSQMTDPHFTNVYFPTNGGGGPPTLNWATVPGMTLRQIINNGNGITVRTNVLQDIFLTFQTNNMWVGVGYTVSNWFTNAGGGSIPGVGTLYRYVSTTTAPLYATNWLYSNFNNYIAANNFTNSVFHRIADGVIHLKLTAFDATGNEMYWEPYYDPYGSFQVPSGQEQYSLQYPVIVPNPTNLNLVQTNYLPHSIDIELGVLEPEAFEHARALFSAGPGALPAAQGYLVTNAANQVEIFRQHVIIPAAP